MRWFLVAGFTSLGIFISGCGNDDEPLLGPPGTVTLTITSDGVIVEPALWDSPNLYLTMVNDSDELRSVRIRFHGQDVEPLEFGLAPGDSRSETVLGFDVDVMRAAGMRLEWENDELHVYLREIEPTPTRTPRPESCPYSGDRLLGYSQGLVVGLLLDFEGKLSGGAESISFYYFPSYVDGYTEAYTDGVAAVYHGQPTSTPADINTYAVSYQRGYEDGLADGYARMTSGSPSQAYQEGYFEGYFDGILDEEELCEPAYDALIDP